MVDQLWTLPEVSKYWADHTPNKEAYIFINKHGPHSTWTARDVYILAGRFASRLCRCGFAPGDVIANGLPNSPERVITDLGTAMAGCISLNCETVEKNGGDFWDTANVSKCKGVIFPNRSDNPAFCLFSPFLLGNSQGIAGFRDIAVPNAPLLTKAFVIMRDRAEDEKENSSIEKNLEDGIVLTKNEAFLKSLTGSQEDVYMASCSRTDDVYIFNTSGSTGACKLIPRTHEELLRMTRRFNSDSIKFFNDRQMSWLGGFPFNYYSNCTPRLLQDALDGLDAKNVTEIWGLLGREGCDSASLASSDILDLIKEFEVKPPGFKLKTITTAGQPLRKNAMAALGKLTDVIVNIYASTETGMISLYAISDPSVFSDYACGRPADGVQIRIVDENMQDVAQGTEGNIIIKSENMLRHYYHNAPSQPVFTQDGWFIIGDRGFIDENGILYVPCRQGDVVTQGTNLIYLSWPESVLSKCPDVANVAAIGVKASNGDDKICACVVPRKDSGLTEENLLKFYNEYFMESLSDSILKPQISYIMFYDALPLSFTGKLDKRKLRADAARKFQLNSVV